MRRRRTSDAGILPYIPFSRTAALPFYQQIYEGYREAIVAGRLRPGQGLPSTRALAAELGISRLPVVNAFEQLVHEGYVHCGRLLTVGNTEAGLHLTALLPAGMDDREVIRRAEERGVTAMALSTCYARATATSGLVLGFGGADERGNDEASRTLAAVIREMA